MKMNKTIFASLFVVCLLAMTSVGVFASADDTEASEGIHYKEVDKLIDFNGYEANDGAKTINDAAGEVVCVLEDNDLTFTKSVNLKFTDTYYKMIEIKSKTNVFNIILNDGVVVNLTGGYNSESPNFHLMECQDTDVLISGNGEFNIILTDTPNSEGKSCAINLSDSDLTIYNAKVRIHAHENIGVYSVASSPRPGVVGENEFVLNNANVYIEARLALGGFFGNGILTINDVNRNSTYKFEGTDSALNNKVKFSEKHSDLFGSMSYRATNLEDFNADKIYEYQYISTENNPISVALIPAIIVFVVATIGLTYFVFFKPSRLPWQEEIYQAQVAKEKAERDALRAEQKRNADAIQAEIAQKRAIERKASEDRKAEELKRKEEERKVLEEKRAAERKEADERRAEENRRKEEEKRVLRERKEAEAKARAEAKAAEAKAAEERKAEEARKRDAERKALHEKKVAEAKAAEERRAEEARRKEAERKALHERKLAEEKAKAEAKAKERAEKEAAKKN